MDKLRLILRLTEKAWKSICQQFLLLAVLSMLFLLLTGAAGPVANELLTQGIRFSGLTFAVCAPEGDTTPRLLEELTGRMEDIRQYASFRSMELEAAAAALEAGELSAVIVLPEQFIGGVLGGSNPDVTLLVSPKKPLEALLAYWVGQSAADLLTASQQGIYAVLEVHPAEGWDQAMTDINLRYITSALDRSSAFRHRELKAVGSMDLGSHYSLSLMIFLVTLLPPLLRPLYEDAGSAMRQRLRLLGHGGAVQYGCATAMAFAVLLPTVLLSALWAGWSAVGAVLLALYGAVFAGVCCLLGRSAAGCAGITYPTAAAALFVSGGVLPMPLLPPLLQTAGAFSPVTALRSLLYAPSGDALAVLALWLLPLSALGMLLYRRRLRKGDT